MRIRKNLIAVGLGALMIVGAMAVPAQATQSGDVRVGTQASTNGESAAAAKWQYTGQRYFFAIECHQAAAELTYITGWPGQCRGPHTDGYYYLWAYH
jgi:hypothetical protein